MKRSKVRSLKRWLRSVLQKSDSQTQAVKARNVTGVRKLKNAATTQSSPAAPANRPRLPATAPPSRKIGKTIPLDVETMLRIPETEEKSSRAEISQAAKHS
jgi:hypothetical protein